MDNTTRCTMTYCMCRTERTNRFLPEVVTPVCQPDVQFTGTALVSLLANDLLQVCWSVAINPQWAWWIRRRLRIWSHWSVAEFDVIIIRPSLLLLLGRPMLVCCLPVLNHAEKKCQNHLTKSPRMALSKTVSKTVTVKANRKCKTQQRGYCYMDKKTASFFCEIHKYAMTINDLFLVMQNSMKRSTLPSRTTMRCSVLGTQKECQH